MCIIMCICVARSEVREDMESALMFNRNFGSSLIAGYSDHYLSDFVLHGTSNTTSNFHSRLHADLTLPLQVLDIYPVFH